VGRQTDVRGFLLQRSMKFFKRRDLWMLLCLSLAMRLGIATLITRPGYMDAAYYAVGAVRLAQGGGLNEPFLWNYLDDPAGLPHPGFLYWMPLPSLLAAPFAALFPGSFFALQFPFAVIAALLPLVAYGVAWEVTAQRRVSWTAALLTLFSGFLFPYWNLPETFAPFALWGSAALWLAGRQQRWFVSLAVGFLVGLAHLTRADGVLLLPVVVLVPLLSSSLRKQYASRLGACSSLIISGYLLVMIPWFVRNLSVSGSLLSPAGTKTLWLTEYNDLFCYGCDLSLSSYLAWGWDNILASKLYALWINFQRLLAEDCQVFLLPFVLIGLYRLRRRPSFLLCLVYWVLLYLFHSLAFTFPGWRGGFFHSSGVLLPFLCVAAVEGLDAAVGWVGRRRRWNLRQARKVFTTAAVVAAMVLSGYAAAQKLPAWWNADEVYRELGSWFDTRAVPADTVIMVDNPPGFYYHTGRPSIVVPNSDVDMLLEVCERYGVDYLVLDVNRPVPLTALYESRMVPPWLALETFFERGNVMMWRVER
jgi:4-amino-4-deoxy-L-arabinose transferase-like glycosyltransferase